jgi:hypothetical protein
MNFPAGITDTERAYMVAAYVVMRHGDAYVPLLDRLEKEVAAERAGSPHRQRAAEILRSFTREVANVVR